MFAKNVPRSVTGKIPDGPARAQIAFGEIE
jgi:hypothetical protein